jgi:hypothetical protein
MIRAFAEGPDQATAETTALNALNNQRVHRYGLDTTGPNKAATGGTHTLDVT